jgi:hypothetical protein
MYPSMIVHFQLDLDFVVGCWDVDVERTFTTSYYLSHNTFYGDENIKKL